ncbi:MAG: stage II sporulation protein E [Clostridia bacterium]|nr:stage II sporulation protein E [Clostridia bacterium]
MSEVGIFKRVSERREQSEGILRMPSKKDIPSTIFMLLAGRAAILRMYPFSVAMFAAVYDKKIAYLGMIAASVGLLSAGAGVHTIKYVFGMMVFWLFSRIKDDYKENKILSSAICGISVIAGGLSAFSSFSIYDFFLLFAEGLLSAFMYVVFERADTMFSGKTKRNRISQEEIICFCISMGVIIMSFSGIVLPFDISMSKLFSIYAVMVLAMNTSLATAGSGGLAAGIVCGMDNPDVIGVMGTYGFCSLIGNLLKSFGKYGVVVGFLSGCAVIMLYGGTSLYLPIKISEVIFAGALFVLTPHALHNKMTAFFSKTYHENAVRPDIRIKEYLAMRLENASGAFKKLSDSFGKISEKQLSTGSGDIATIFDDTADRVCKNCGMWTHCWQRGFNDTYRNMFALLGVLENKGTLHIEDVPSSFKEKCIRPEQIANTFNHVYEMYKQNSVWLGEIAQNRDLIAQQYNEISHIMNQFSAEVASGFEFMEETEVKIMEELDKLNINVKEVSVIESGNGETEVYLTLKDYNDKEYACEAVSTILDMPMMVDESFSGEMVKLIPKCNFDVDIGIMQLPKSTENGDSIVYLKTEDNKFILALSDGMGSGYKAMEQSMMTTELLTEFLRAGFCRGTSINMINSSLTLKSGSDCFSTVDLLSIDLETGSAEFLKAGASESYIKHCDNIETIFCTALPAGMLANAEVESEKRQLKKGDVVVMMSDGISDAGKSLVRGEWIKKAMLSEYKNAQTLAEIILSGALKRSRGSASDDMSVAVIKVI